MIRVAVVVLVLAVVSGCSRAVEVKLDPWQEYQIALDIVDHEERLQMQVLDMHQKDPTPENKERLDKMNARFDKATKHAKAVREKLPN